MNKLSTVQSSTVANPTQRECREKTNDANFLWFSSHNSLIRVIRVKTSKRFSWMHSSKTRKPAMLYSPAMRGASIKSSDCAGDLHPAAIRGMELFNAGEYWLAHEELEEAWKGETGAVRELYRGILQTAVVYLHVTRVNYNGAVKVYHRVQKWITPWPDICRGIEIGRLRRDLEVVIAEVRRLGPDRLVEFDRSLLRPVRWT